MRALLLFSLLAGCSKPPPAEAPPERARTYVRGDPAPTLDRVRKNAIESGCKVQERTAGTLVTCGDVELWLVPDPNGMEVTCTGLPLNCNKRGRELMRTEDSDAGQ